MNVLAGTPPVPIQTVSGDHDNAGGGEHLVVNRSSVRDANVVISWTDDDGMRQAAGMTPAQALVMADALKAAAYVVGGLK